MSWSRRGPTTAPTTAGDDEGSDDEDPTIGLGGLISAVPIPTDEAERLVGEFRAVEGVDGAIQIVRAPAPALHEAKGQAEPLTLLMGLPDDMTGFEGDLRNVDGGTVAVTDLGEGEIFASEGAADELDLEPGDTVTFTLGEQQADGTVQTVTHEYTVKAVVKDGVLAGSLLDEAFGFTLPIAELQDIVNRNQEVDMIAVSNDGGVRDGVGGHRGRHRRTERDPRRHAVGGRRRKGGPRRHGGDRCERLHDDLRRAGTVLDRGGHAADLPHLRDARRGAEGGDGDDPRRRHEAQPPGADLHVGGHDLQHGRGGDRLRAGRARVDRAWSASWRACSRSSACRLRST